MNPLYLFRRRLKLYKSFSRNPRRSMAGDIAKNAFLMGLVGLAAWLTYSTATQRNPAPTRSQLLESTAVNAFVSSDTNEKTTDTSPDSADIGESGQTTFETDAVSRTDQIADHDKIYESEWILLLPDEKFVVQIGSSPDRGQLYQDAKGFPFGPVSFYPFKLTPSKRIIYGFAAGVYDSLEEASLAIKQWPASAVERDPWIRPVKILKEQVKALAN